MITQLENDLFERYKHNECYSTFVPDGVVSPDSWMQQNVKIIFLLKEVNSEYKSFDLRQFLYKGGKARTWNNIAIWTCGILNDSDWNTAKNAPFNRANWLHKIAVINVKKKGGTSNTDTRNLIKFFDANNCAELLSGQLDILHDANYIICCGKGVYSCLLKALKINPLLAKWHHIREQMNEDNLKILMPTDGCKSPYIIDFYHPQCRIKHETLFSLLMKAVTCCKNNSNIQLV